MKNNPSELHRLCLVSRTWNEVFSLTRAQNRWDNLIDEISIDNAEGWMYHKVIYRPAILTNTSSRRLPVEGTLVVHRSNVETACLEAMQKNSSGDSSYCAYREMPMCIELVLPKKLFWTGDLQLNFVNEITWDEIPRLVGEFCVRSDVKNDEKSSSQARDNKVVDDGCNKTSLGFHEIVSVKNRTFANIHPRPALRKHGECTTSYLAANKVDESATPRWVKFAHIVGEDRCRMFIRKHLLPMMGTRPTGNNWQSHVAVKE
mmetsp:Transcript_14445/g.29452  ORF Transcript_14445/g.29452 Transcript_14445/m.29452 type:complete len:260 (-) Transcript_14445:286-1065(-)